MGSTLTIKANLAEHGQSLRVKKKQSVNKDLKLAPGSGVAKRLVYKPQEPTFSVKCFNYGLLTAASRRNKARAHMEKMKGLSQDVHDMHLWDPI
ncbi:unnamed protein product [Camellia sinensis]